MNTPDKGAERRPNPQEDTYNPASLLTFWWMRKTFFNAITRELSESDLYKPLSTHKSDHLGSRLEDAWNDQLKRCKKKNQVPSLRKAVFSVFGFPIIGLIIFSALIEFGLNMTQPLALGQFIAYYSPGQTEITKNEAYIFAAAVVGCSLFNVLLRNPYMLIATHLGIKMRIACSSLLYRKALRLSKQALGETTVGQIVNLMSNDVTRMEEATLFYSLLFIGPLQAVALTYFMYCEMGYSVLFGILLMILFIPLQGWLGKRASILRLRTALRTDNRLRLMNEIINGIQVIKMYAWEKPFATLVDQARRSEVSSLRKIAYIWALNISFMSFVTRISVFISVLVYVLTGNVITAKKVFIVTACYDVLRLNMTDFFPYAVMTLAETLVSLKRIQTFLLQEELSVKYINEPLAKTDKANELNKHIEANGWEQGKGVSIKDGAAKWNEDLAENTLSGITFNVPSGKLLTVIGQVGSGKSSLLQVILKELKLRRGCLNVMGSVSYASQEPWLFPGTVRQNILFGQPFNAEKYKTVIRVCALQRDFSLLPHGDLSIVGERGITLSGGQRARINLARAVYKDADIYLLDDPLSAVDTHVGKELFENCIRGYLRNKACILITHQLQYLKDVDEIIVLETGHVVGQGNYNDLKASGLDLMKMLAEPHMNDEPADQPIRKRLLSEMSIKSELDSEIEKQQQEEELRSEGKVPFTIYKAYLRAGGNWLTVLLVFLLFVGAQISLSFSDFFIAEWMNIEELRRNNSLNHISDQNLLSTDTCIKIYAAATIALAVLTLSRGFSFFLFCMKASINLHDNLFRCISRARMSFFNNNPSGRILNRFSKDTGAVDERLPLVTLDFGIILLVTISLFALISVVNPWLLIPTAVICITVLLMRNVFIPTSRSLKRIESRTRSPVYSHLTASLQGLTTIRAFGTQQALIKEFDEHVDLNSGAVYLFICSNRALSFWLDTVCIVYITVVTMSFLVLGEERYGGNVGLAVTQCLALIGMLQWGIRQSTEMINQMTSVERILEYSSLETEPALETPENRRPAKTWPERGQICYRDMSLRYSANDQPVLKSLNFTVEAKEKVGIVGRTGAGKSSLISALFRLFEPEGAVVIDGYDTKDLGLHDLRSKISIIPQEPVLFSGTMRKNLDPFEEYKDHELWEALREVELKDAVEDLNLGLNTKISEGGNNFSVGQRQLVCLARAILRKNKILVLDEATANVDPQTDALIQMTIRKKFADCTVLTIAHRLHTVMDSDRILVMDAGEAVEFGRPHELLKNSDGYLYKMVEQTGKTMAQSLANTAKEAYDVNDDGASSSHSQHPSDDNQSVT